MASMVVAGGRRINQPFLAMRALVITMQRRRDPNDGEDAQGGEVRMPTTPQRGDFVRVRTRRWLVEEERSAGDKLATLRLACVDDDAQGEVVEVLWDAELDGSVLKDEGWASVAKFGTDDPSVFSAYLRALRWNTATAADRDLFQAPFRAGIHQDAYQLLPLRKALRLPRVNLLIAEDVGAGKTVEAVWFFAKCFCGDALISFSSPLPLEWFGSGKTNLRQSSASPSL
jgi:hypothetical protein